MAVIICPGCGLRGQIPDTVKTPSLRCPRCNTDVPNPGPSDPPGTSDRAAPAAHTASPGHMLDEFFARAYAAASLPPTLTTPIPPVAAGPPAMPAPQPPMVAAPPAMAVPQAATAPPHPPMAPPQAPAARSTTGNGATSPSSPSGSPEAEEQWIREERQRLDAYMSKHFALLQKQREEFSQWRTQVEAALVGREQELNRQQKLLNAQNDMLQQRTAELAEKEGSVTKQIEEISSAGAEVLQEVAAQKGTLEKLRKEVEQTRQEMQRAQQEQIAQQSGFAKQKQAMEAERAAFISQTAARKELQEPLEKLRKEMEQTRQEMNRARQEQIAQQSGFAKQKQAIEAERSAWVSQSAARKELQESLAKAEATLRRRVSEALNLEAQIYHELERQEQRLAIERRHIEQTRQDFMAAGDEKTALRRKLAAMSQELEKLRRPPTPPKK
jgi:hypothetical protein